MNKKLLFLCIFVFSAFDLQAKQSLAPIVGPQHLTPALTIIYSGGLGGNISSCG